MVKDERSVIVLYEWMLKNNKFKKEWHSATKPLLKKTVKDAENDRRKDNGFKNAAYAKTRDV